MNSTGPEDLAIHFQNHFGHFHGVFFRVALDHQIYCVYSVFILQLTLWDWFEVFKAPLQEPLESFKVIRSQIIQKLEKIREENVRFLTLNSVSVELFNIVAIEQLALII